MVQVHHDEGVANRIDPESCADTREGIGEALTGERIGQPLSRESTLILGADVVPVTEGNTDGRDNASAQTARRGLRHWHVRTLCAREPGDLMVGQRQHACCTGPCRPQGTSFHCWVDLVDRDRLVKNPLTVSSAVLERIASEAP